MDKTALDEIVWGITPTIKSLKRNVKEAEYINYIIKLVSRKTGKKYKTILDIPCGEGRLHPYLRKYGYDVYGVDINARFIRKAREKYKKYATNYVTANMKSFSSDKKFDVVLCWFTSFGYLDEHSNLATLRVFSTHLRKGGLLLLNVLNQAWYVHRKATSSQSKEYEISENPGFLRLVTINVIRKGSHRYILHSSKTYKKVQHTLTLVRRFRQPIRLYAPKEITRMMKIVGIKTIYSFKCMSLNPGTKARNVLFVGVRS